MDRLGDRIHDFHDALRERTGDFIPDSTALVATAGGLAFTAASLI